MLGLENFSFLAVWHPIVMLFVLGLIFVYLWVTEKGRHHFSESEPVPRKKQVSFVVGMVLLYLTQAGPLNLLGHLTFTAHMAAMAISYLLAPPLILYGLPAWLLRPFTRDQWFQRYGKKLLHPVFTILFFNMSFSIYHMPVIYDFVMTHFVLHTLYHLLLLVAAMMMWWPIFSPLPEFSSLTHLKKMGYMFLNGVLLTPACALIIFAPEPLYKTFTDPLMWAQKMAYCVPGGVPDVLEQFSGPDQFSPLSARHDQQLGGVLMKLMQETIYGSILFYIFNQWYRTEKGDDEDTNEVVSSQLNQA